MKKIILLICVFVSFFANAQEMLDAPSRKINYPKAGKEPLMPKFNSNILKPRSATSIDTFFISHAYYNNCYAAGNPPLRSFGNIYTALGATNQAMQGVTNYIAPASDGQFNEIFTIFDTLYSAGFNTTSNTFVRKAFIIDSSVSVMIDTVTLRCGLAVEDTTTRNFAGDSIIVSLYSVDKTSKAKIALLKQVSFTGQTELEKFYNNGFIYMANFPFDKYTLPAGVNAIGFLVEYKTTHNEKNVLLVSYNYLDSCQNVTINGQNFRSPAHRPLFPAYTTWNVIDSTSPTAASIIAQNNNFSYPASSVPAPLNCRFLYNQNFYIFPTVIVESKFYGSLATSPNKSAFCKDEKVIISPDVKGGKEPFTYTWTATTGVIDNPTDPAIELTLGTAASNVKCVVKDANGDTIILTKTISVSSPSVTAALSKPNLTACGDVIVITATTSGGTAASYSWSNGGSTTNKLNATAPGSYSVTVTTTNGCTATATSPAIGATYALPPTLDFTFLPSSNICPNKDVEFTITAAATRANWNYTFKDGTTTMGTGTSIMYAFPSSGPKSITLSADSGICTAASVVKALTVLSASDAKCKVGIIESISDNIKVYPNPVRNGEVYIQNDMNQALNITVTDILGKVIYTDKVSGNKTNMINLSNSKNGVYFIEVEGKSDKTIRKILVDKQ